MIKVWRKITCEDAKDIPPLEAVLTYQVSEDKRHVRCNLKFDTPYEVRPTDNVTLHRNKDNEVICAYTLQDGEMMVMHIAHPEHHSPIHGCATRYASNISPVPFICESGFNRLGFNMNIEVKEGRCI